ncbi:MobV family relaxase [Nostoc sp. 'Peltigera membranacea cyanobiont' N6]|uniref:MobV family relaxase n=1 Tax=Nostoc sp. 'Peltigera membranacea cyanobiont' N6 TaxID=1261031 RepID=UPI000CF35F18|nr:MobV family relaxase [Nostoc sp. 'Peltigera membranacea cyanobiont' N6]AVH68470.1 plasmid recombination enzyme [Nostoc sp. 'Peltigera membranacea cyanobiont' N6]
MSPLTILRIEKLKTFGNVAGSDDHVTRNRETPNADPTRENVRLIGGEDERALEEIVKEKISMLKHRPRHDAVLCTEMFLSASPEYFRPKDPSQSGQWSDSLMQQWAIASRDWLSQNYGSKCVRAELHLDESTPHIHAYIVPLNEKTGRVSHDAMFGGRGGQGRIKLSKLQDSYAAALAPLGIERGVKGSKATHTKVKEYYQAVNSEPLTAVITNNQLAPTPFESARSYVDRIQSDDQFQAINHQLADRAFMQERLERAEQRARASEKERQRLEEIVRSLELKTQQLRDLALEDVAWELGLNYERERWRGHGHIINIDAEKFYDFAPEHSKGSGGAIDLVMHVNQCNFRQAVVWLDERFGEASVERAAIAHVKNRAADIIQTEPRPQFTPPVEDKANWSAVENYLTQFRGIRSDCIQMLYNQGLVYADDKQNAVFVMRNLDGQRNGAFLRGTRGENNSFKGYSKGTKRRDSWFYFSLGGKANDKTSTAILCKSPIDAISRAMLEYLIRGDVPPERTVYMAIDDIKSLPLERLQKVPNILVAFGNDKSTDAAAQRVLELMPQSQIKKSKASDWNQQLLDYGQQLRQQQQQQRQQDDELTL